MVDVNDKNPREGIAKNLEDIDKKVAEILEGARTSGDKKTPPQETPPTGSAIVPTCWA